MLPRVRTAMDIKEAVDRASSLPRLGEDVSALLSYCAEYSDFEMAPDDSSAYRDKDLTQIEAVIDKLTKLRSGFNDSHKVGWLPGVHKLRVTRSGCEYDGDIEELKDRLPQWFENAEVSGYGNVQTQETIVDDAVRCAREIPGTEFSVDDELLRAIEGIWSDHFIPSKVRAEPYKIHLYGPGGHFRSHLDTPEKGLVGSFLVGLGDTTTPGGRFRINGEAHGPYAGEYIAFYPDVAHEVLKIEEGYRAVIAFKMFRTEVTQSQGDLDRHSEMLPLLASGLGELQLPFGIYLSHQYEKSMTDPSGFDKLLLEAARALPHAAVRVIPVMDREGASVDEEEPGEECNTSYADVYPLTDAHLDFLLGDKEALDRDLSSAWIKEFSDIPFFGIGGSLPQWSNEYIEGPGYTGNESRAHDQHAVYLSYALVVLPEDKLREIEAAAMKTLQGSGSYAEGSTSQKRRRVDLEVEGAVTKNPGKMEVE